MGSLQFRVVRRATKIRNDMTVTIRQLSQYGAQTCCVRGTRTQPLICVVREVFFRDCIFVVVDTLLPHFDELTHVVIRASSAFIMGAYHLDKKSGNFGLRSNGKATFRKIFSEIVDNLQK